jgi:hypothetical protein
MVSFCYGIGQKYNKERVGGIKEDRRVGESPENPSVCSFK